MSGQQQLLQNHGHEIGAQRDPHFIFYLKEIHILSGARASDFLLTFNFPTFGRRAIAPSIYFSQNSRHQRAIQPLTGNQYAGGGIVICFMRLNLMLKAEII